MVFQVAAAAHGREDGRAFHLSESGGVISSELRSP